jgi:hypothetical protein
VWIEKRTSSKATRLNPVPNSSMHGALHSAIHLHDEGLNCMDHDAFYRDVSVTVCTLEKHVILASLHSPGPLIVVLF